MKFVGGISTLFAFCVICSISAINAQTTEDDLEDFTFPAFTLHPIVEELNPDVPPEAAGNDTSEEGGGGLFDTISVGSLFTKFLRRPKTNTTFNETHEDVYIRMSHMLDEEIEVLIKEVLPFVFEYQQDRVNITSVCSNSLLNMGSALKAKASWAFNFLDSMGGMPSGLLEGTLADLGNFDQCVDARVTKDADFIGVNPILFSGSYCVVELEPPLPEIKDRLTYNTVVLNYTQTELAKTFFERWATYVHDYYSYPISIGICMPSTCTAREVEKVMSNIGKQYNITVKIRSKCHFKGETYTTNFPTLELALILAMVVFVAFASLHEYYCEKKEMKLKRKLANKLLHCFSMIKNSRKLFRTSKANCSPDGEIEDRVVSLNSLHGVKVIALIWLVIADVYLMGGLPLTNLIKNSYTDFKVRGAYVLYQFIINSWSFSAEVFLFLSGLVLAFKTFDHLNKSGKLNLFRHIIYRWIRLTPTVIGVLLLTFVMFSPYSGSGPIFHRNAEIITIKCYNNWWANVFYLNNWFSIDEMCFEQMWILSAGFQMYVIAFFILLFLYKRPVFGIILSSMLIFIGVVVPGFVTFLHKLPPTFIFNNPLIKQVKEDMELNFFPTYDHFSSYFIGILLGFWLSKIQKVETSCINCLKWFIYIPIALIPILITIQWNSLEIYPNWWISVIYSSFHRIVWILGITGITYQLVTEKGAISKLLSTKLFLVLSRLSLHIYLNHYLVIWYYYLSRRSIIVYRDMDLLMVSCGLFLASTIMSYFTYNVFEAPFKAISSMFSKYEIQKFLNKNANHANQNTSNIPTHSAVNGVDNPTFPSEA